MIVDLSKEEIRLIKDLIYMETKCGKMILRDYKDMDDVQVQWKSRMKGMKALKDKIELQETIVSVAESHLRGFDFKGG